MTRLVEASSVILYLEENKPAENNIDKINSSLHFLTTQGKSKSRINIYVENSFFVRKKLL